MSPSSNWVRWSQKMYVALGNVKFGSAVSKRHRRRQQDRDLMDSGITQFEQCLCSATVS